MSVEATALELKTELDQNVQALLNVSTADIKAIMKYYEVTDDILTEMVQNVRRWYEKQPHLPEGQLHDRQILGHLLLRAFSVERAKNNLENFYTARQRLPELLRGRDPNDKEWLRYLEKGHCIVSPKKTVDNNRVIILRLNGDENGIMAQMMKVGLLIAEYRIWNEVSIGDCWIIDCKNSKMQHAMQMTPVLISKIIYILSSCFGTKLKSLYMINMPPFVASILNLVKKGVKPKLANRIHVIKAEELLDIFPKDVLPEEYGGTEVSCQEITDEWFKTFQTEPWKKYLVEQDNIVADDSKRLTPSSADEIFGAEGSFRKLCLD